jgi:hypothetical protein
MRSALLGISILALTAFWADAAESPNLSASLTVEVVGPQLATLPLQLKLTISNTGKAPFYYWCGGPGQYPDADPFTVAVTDATGRTRKYRLHNGQYIKGSGRDYPINTRQTLPATCDPLSRGNYTLKVTGKSQSFVRNGEMVEHWPAMSAEPITIKVEDNPSAVAKAEKDLMARAEKDPFARHLVRVYGIDPIVKTWLNQLLSDDPKVAWKAMGELQNVLRLPAGGDVILARAAVKQSHPESGKVDENLLEYIAHIAHRLEAERSMDAGVPQKKPSGDTNPRSPPER